MDASALQPYFQARSMSASQLISSTASLSVYKGQWRTCLATIKVLTLEQGADHRRMERECTAMVRLQHPNIVKMYDCFWCSDRQKYYLVIVVEWCTKDLTKDIEQRRTAGDVWTEDKLWVIVRGLVSALAYMQREGFAHRDIKPQTLFVLSENLVKIGDFGSGRFADTQEHTGSQTSAEVQSFLSPLLRRRFVENQNDVVHNAFKSDAYSLGLTFLYMTSQCDLDSLQKSVISPHSLCEATQAIPFSDTLKSMLWWMLQYEEIDRCDFLQLSAWLEHTFNPLSPCMTLPVQTRICMFCSSPVESIRREVTLECSPNHQFCSPQCFTAFLNHASPVCPQCRSPVSASFLQQHGYSILEVQAPTLPAPPLKCMQCFSSINLTDPSSASRVVQLYCKPRQHVFCTEACFGCYVTNDNPRCPICKVDIDPTIIQEAMQKYDGTKTREAVGLTLPFARFRQRKSLPAESWCISMCGLFRT